MVRHVLILICLCVQVLFVVSVELVVQVVVVVVVRPSALVRVPVVSIWICPFVPVPDVRVVVLVGSVVVLRVLCPLVLQVWSLRSGRHVSSRRLRLRELARQEAPAHYDRVDHLPDMEHLEQSVWQFWQPLHRLQRNGSNNIPANYLQTVLSN